MVVDYYNLLQVPRKAKDDELKKAAKAKLKEITDAYDVLSDPRKREVYDQKGEEGLKTDSSSSGRQNGRSPADIISVLFGSKAGPTLVQEEPGDGPEPGNSLGSNKLRSTELMSWFIDCHSSLKELERRWSKAGDESRDDGSLNPEDRGRGGGSAGEGGGVRSGLPRKNVRIQTKLLCSLKELYQGTTKERKISRDVLSVNGQKNKVEETLTIEIKPGSKEGTKFTFPEKGDDVEQGVIPADIIFVIHEKPEKPGKPDRWKRNGDDLIFYQSISLALALTKPVGVKTFDGREISIPPLTSLNHEEVLKGEGMPIQGKTSEKGNLILKLNLEFPPMLTSKQKTKIKELFPPSK